MIATFLMKAASINETSIIYLRKIIEAKYTTNVKSCARHTILLHLVKVVKTLSSYEKIRAVNVIVTIVVKLFSNNQNESNIIIAP
jgi:hypothetical protein